MKMNIKRNITTAALALLAFSSVGAKGDSISVPEQSVIDEVIWVVGDESILKSDVEVMRIQAQETGMRWKGDPDCAIPEQIAVQKLFLHQAAIDSIEVTEGDISKNVEYQIEEWTERAGSREKLEEYRKQSISQMREEMHDAVRDQLTVRRMKQKLVEDVKVTPAEVRRHFKNMPQDSLPFIQTQVEVQIITQNPKMATAEINRVKDQLRDFTDRVNKGETSFATLARLYSEDGSARQGGELGYMSRGQLDPAFAAVAFNLTDPSKVSKIVESEFGYHIIQLIDRRGERVNVRHIILKPVLSDSAINAMLARLDSIRTEIVDNKFTFDEGAAIISMDKDTRNNHGLMKHTDMQTGEVTSRIKMENLPTEVARQVESMQVGDISKPFTMLNSKGNLVCAIVKLKNRIPAHRANITEDYQALKGVVLQKRQEEKLHQWVVDKIKNTYVRVADRYKNCEYEYEGWIK